MASVGKTYADAIFALLSEENSDKTVFDSVLSQLKCVQSVIAEIPDFVKLLNTPTISNDEKLKLVDSVFGGKVNEYVGNFLKLIVVKKRMNDFNQICKEFRIMYNEKFDIAEIVVTTAVPLTDSLRKKIVDKMSAVTGKTVLLTEKIDKQAVIGGIVVDYGNTRLDGSVKTRLAQLKNDIGSIIA